MSEVPISSSRRSILRAGFSVGAGILLGSRFANEITRLPEMIQPFPVGLDQAGSKIIRLKNPQPAAVQIISEMNEKVWKTDFFQSPFHRSDVLPFEHEHPVEGVGELYAGEWYYGHDINKKEPGLCDTNGDGFVEFGLWYKITEIKAPANGGLLDRLIRATDAYPF